MLREEKDKAVKVFHEVDDVKVLVSFTFSTNYLQLYRSAPNFNLQVASLKCGGQGLNLTCANRVILIDPWWNSAMEQQGYGRVFRMGQTKETYFVRLLAKNTIDGRLAELQAKKLKKIKEMVKDYDSARSAPKFEEVAELFGKVKYNEQGEVMEVESDYDSDDDFDDDDDNDGEGASNGGANGNGGSLQDMDGLGALAAFNNNGYGVQDEIDLT